MFRRLVAAAVIAVVWVIVHAIECVDPMEYDAATE